MKKKETELPQIADSSIFVDTHCHLDMGAYSDDLEDVLNQSSRNHIGHIVTIGIDLPSSKTAVAIARNYKMVSATIGIHPHEVDTVMDCHYTELEQLYHQQSNHIVGYGEIGLDYFKGHSNPATQRTHFARQLDLAHSLKLPIIVHNRDADDDTLRLLREAQPLDYGGIMHCFSGDISFAHKILDLGMIISIPGIVTFKNATTLHEVAKKIPIDSIVLETDGPFLAPHPYRGKRNVSSYLLYTAKKIADLRGIDIDLLGYHTTCNSKKIFKLNAI